jgi:homocysteine S-methyltransferase
LIQNIQHKGTTLEDRLNLDYISSSPLWSARAVIEDSESVVNAHLAFLRAGAQIIQTSTYQCSFETFERAGYTRADACRIMLRSVELAATARYRFHAERAGEESTTPILIALSLGPYGAMLSPTQEYGGFYPPPYGPKGFTSHGDNVNYFMQDQNYLSSIDALEQFHLERLEVFLEVPSIWRFIDCLAFETVPLVREAIAIRKAVTKAFTKYPESASTFWWMSCVFPDGSIPECATTGNSGTPTSLDVSSIISAMFNKEESLATPQGIGINCTRLEFLPELVAEFQAALVGGDSDTDFSSEHRPQRWLVLYPNGGDVYDPISRSWIIPGSLGSSPAPKWSEQFLHVLRDSMLVPKLSDSDLHPSWAGVIVGGCCRVGAEDIEALKKMLCGTQ